MADAIGIDIVETARIAKDLSTYGDRFLNRILGPDELKLYEQRADRIQFLAGRFAAKEAVVKALGRYLSRRPAWASIQIVYDDSGNPELLLPSDLQDQLARVRCLVSISHSRSSAVAMAVFTEE